MPVFLEKHDGISFVCAKNFTYSGVRYGIGEDFPDGEAKNSETLVRSRYIIPVIEDDDDRPRHWYRHIQKKSLVLQKLGRGSHLLNKPERVPEVEVPQAEESDEFDPSDHTIDEVLDYVENYPDEVLSVYTLEEEGKHRKTLLAKLDEILNKETEPDE